jgi:hypothetical protein
MQQSTKQQGLRLMIALDLLQKDVSYMNEYWPNRTSTGDPKYYAMWDQNTIYLAPTPNHAYNIELALNRNETGLSGTNTTTWVSQNAPQVLLYACLLETFKFLKGPYDLLAQYEKSYQQAVDTTCKLNNKEDEEETNTKMVLFVYLCLLKTHKEIKNGYITSGMQYI